MNLLLSLFFSLQVISPASDGAIPAVSDELIAQHTVYFDIQDATFTGAEPLIDALEASHFIALGELHNRTRLGELTEALLRTLEPHGFQYFAIETGPYSARKLEQLIREGESDVSAFYAAYSSRIYDIVPIPFFSGQTDLQFLAAANSLGYELWGLDQEFYFSYAYLIDEIARLAEDSMTGDQRRLHRKLQRRLAWLDRWNQFRELFVSNYQRSCRVQNLANFQAYLESFAQSADPDIQQILDALKQTIDIYCMAEIGEASEPVRINYFKANFERNFEAALAVHPEPKVFLKMGSFHMGRYQSPLGLYDIGNHVSEIAKSRNQTSTHIYYLNRFFDGYDMRGRSGWEDSEHFVGVGDKTQWALVDLRPLRHRLANETLTGKPFELSTIQNYDFIIIAPEDHWVERHW